MPTAIVEFLSNTRAQMKGEYDFKFVRDLLSYHPEGYKFAKAYKQHVWDGYVRLLTANGTFPAGLAWHVKEALEKKGTTITFAYGVNCKNPGIAVKHTKDVHLGGGVRLYPWQAKAVRTAVEAHRGVLKMATGAGKTECMAGVIKCLETTRLPKTLIIVPNRNLLRQTKERLEKRLECHVGNIGYGQWEEDFVTVAIPNSLILPKFKERFQHLMATTEVIMLDECHHSAATTWEKSLATCNAWYRFGFSGTPLDRSDGGSLKLQGQTGPVVVDIGSALLVSQGKLAKPTVEIINIREPRHLPDGLDWSNVYRLGVVKNRAFHRQVTNRVREEVEKGRQVLVLVTRIEHGEALSEMLAADPLVPHAWLHGKTDPAQLKDSMEMFLKGVLPVLVASTIFGEGTDLPNIDTLVIADGGRSVIRTIQKAGRALRPKKNRPNTATLIDFRHWSHSQLYTHSKERVAVYKREGFDVVDVPDKEPTRLLRSEVP
jgi:superfamily II DNA or RNA helicase